MHLLMELVFIVNYGDVGSNCNKIICCRALAVYVKK